MVALLSTSRTIPKKGYHYWAAINLEISSQDAGKEVRDLNLRLENAFENVLCEWLDLGRSLSGNSSASLAHTPSCAPNVSDLGIMLAWSNLIREWVEGEETVLIVCDDPWLFRHFVSLGAQVTSSQPPLWWHAFRLTVRGFLSRSKVAVCVAVNMLLLLSQRQRFPIASTAILAYGHPASTADGYDGYFGPLMREIPKLVRVLHVDCGYDRARKLSRDNRTYSLHAWGSLPKALTLPFIRWRPRDKDFPPRHSWLIRRAVALEGGTGQAAMIGWQQICHQRWLAQAAPGTVTWPWENHAWERHFVAVARTQGVRTLGYQHTPFGRQDYSFSLATNPSGLGNVPDAILCSGEACQDALQDMGYPEKRLQLVGSLRFFGFKPLVYDSSGPVLFALPYHAVGASQMAEAANNIAVRGNKVLVKRHPMATKNLDRAQPEIVTTTPFSELPGISVLVFANSSIGLEALFGGIPVIRFMPHRTILLDAMPAGVTVKSAGAADLEKQINSMTAPVPVSVGCFFGPVDFVAWSSLLDCA